jgi:hypothetical protein
MPMPTAQFPAGQPPYGAGVQYPAEQVPGYGGPGYGAPKPKRTGLVVGVIVAVVVLALGGIGVWYVTGRGAGTATGAATSQDAAAKLVADVSNSDLVGLVNDLAPAEASLIKDTMSSSNDQLKRLQIVKPGTDWQKQTGLTSSGLKFDDSAAEKINDHLTITKLVAGRITINADWTKSGFTDEFMKAAFPDGVPGTTNSTVDIGKIVRHTGNPIRIATIKVNGTWYPSLFYSVADAGLRSAHKSWPTTGLPAVGAATADLAVKQFVQALLDGDFSKAIEMTSPDEMAVLHDVGPVILDMAGNVGSSGVTLRDVQINDQIVPGGVDAVVTGVTIVKDGQEIKVTEGNGCFTITDVSGGQSQQMCASDLEQAIGQSAGILPAGFGSLVKRLTDTFMNIHIGIVTSQHNGQWYVSPGRTFTTLFLDLMNVFQPGDMANLLQLAINGGH